MLQYIDY